VEYPVLLSKKESNPPLVFLAIKPAAFFLYSLAIRLAEALPWHLLHPNFSYVWVWVSTGTSKAMLFCKNEKREIESQGRA
jgi:hypothetical protein